MNSSAASPRRPSPEAPHGQALDALAAALATDPRTGLTEAEAAARLARDGPNELTSQAPTPAWRRLVSQFRSGLVVLLLVATALSAGIWFYERDTALPYDALAIFAVVVLNAVLGFVQEARAEAAVAALRAMAAASATVVRDGTRQRVPTTAVVVGDLILLEEGDTIPADGRLVESIALQAGEASLTGESLPVDKETAVVEPEAPLGDRRNMVFSGTAVTFGRGTALVTATGMHTEVGRIANLLSETRDAPTPLQEELDRTSRRLGLVVVAIALVMSVTILVVDNIREASGIVDVLILGVALAVAAVPEGLPAVVTAVLAIGVQRMARRHAIVRHLAAVETLGSATIIASDKTGTLTRNEMTVRAIVTAGGHVAVGGTGYAPAGELTTGDGAALDGPLRQEVEHALTAATRANNASLREQDGAWIVHGDPTEGALLVAARKAGLQLEALDASLPRVGELPFSSERKLMSTLHEDAERSRRVVFVKGAPDVLLTRCRDELVGDGTRPLTPGRRDEILRVNASLAGDALRTLGVARREAAEAAGREAGDADAVERDLTFAGLIGMIDPPRAEAAAAVSRARHAGIRPLMITGDHPATASVIARELGISDDGRTVTGAELESSAAGTLDATVATVSVYARVNPEHKLRIVEALQRTGAIVAMTGDGVNDAPALKKADIGIAMGRTGTDVSKEASDIVLADDNFASIVAAVEEGRAIFANIRKFLRYLLSSNIGEVLTMFVGVLAAERLGLPVEDGTVVLPLLATQILWINLVTDGPPALALGVDPPDDDLMDGPPRPPDEPVITRRMWKDIFVVGAIMAAATLLVVDASLPGGFIPGSGTLPYAQTMAFTTLMLCQMFNVANARSDVRSAFVHPFTNAWLWAAVALSVVLQVAVVHVPFLQQAFGTVALDAWDWLRCAGVASLVLWLREAMKLSTRLRSRRA